MVIKYNKQTYNEDSPWIFFTDGIKSNKNNLVWNRNDVSVLNRGFVCAYPILRGTNYLDSNWLNQGIEERKLTHFMDLIDSAIFIKEKGLTKKIGVFGQGQSGSVTALTSIFKEPYLFECCVAHNPITDLINHLMYDIEDMKKMNSSESEYTNHHFEKLKEYGDPKNKIFFDSHKFISPYHQRIIDES